MRKWFFVLSLLLLAAPATSAEVAARAPRRLSGVVYVDKNRNGRCDPGEGLAGVRVTDGVQFVKTGPDGSYSITVSDDPLFPFKPAQVVSVCWPAGVWPAGPWSARLDQVADPQHVELHPREDKQPATFMFAQITDDHSAGAVVENFGKNFPRMGEALKFVIETGDLGYAVADGADKEFSDILKHGRTLPVPILYVPGNHDYVGIHSTDWSKQDPLAGGGAYTKYLGPTRWSFDYAGSHFVGLDWGTPDAAGKLQCGVPPIAQEFLKHDLETAKAGANLFVFLHYPDVPPEVLRAEKFANVCVIGGHSHQFGLWKEGKAIYTTQIALWGGGACGLVHVAGSSVDFVYRCAGCRWGDWQGMAKRGEHLGFCPMHHFAFRTLPAVEKVRVPLRQIADKPLAGSEVIETGKENKALAIDLEILPGDARTIGLRLCGQDRLLPITWDGVWLACDGIRVPMPLRDWEKTVRLRAVVQGGTVEMQINGMYQFTRPLAAGPLKIEAYAVGGKATIKKFCVYRYDPAALGKSARP